MQLELQLNYWAIAPEVIASLVFLQYLRNQHSQSINKVFVVFSAKPDKLGNQHLSSGFGKQDCPVLNEFGNHAQSCSFVIVDPNSINPIMVAVLDQLLIISALKII